MTQRDGWNEQRLADAIGVARSTITRWKCDGANGITVANVLATARALGEDCSVLLHLAANLDAPQEDDPEVALILRAPRSPAVKAAMLERLLTLRERHAHERREDVRWWIKAGATIPTA